METFASRTEMLLGNEAVARLKSSSVLIFGVGGVGGFAAESLARAGVGNIGLVDNDIVSASNINRQIIALTSTIGRYKVDVMEERIKNINPDAEISTYNCFYSQETSDIIDFKEYDYIIDAVDTVTAKLLIIEKARQEGAGVISCMGTGNKLDPEKLTITDISKTSVCPLARVMRKELKARGICDVNVLYSKELPIKTDNRLGQKGRPVPGSVSFVPSVAGLMIGGFVIRDLTGVQI